MPSDRFDVRIPFNKLLIGLLLILVPMCVVGIYTVQRAEKAVDRTIGTHFQTIANTSSSEIAQFINDRIVAVGALAADPTILETCAAANRTYTGMSDEAFKSKVLRLEKEWNTPAAGPVVREALNSRASKLLSRYRSMDRRFLRITLTDSHGATIAATHKTLDYFQADEDFWQSINASGRGAIHLTDVLYDEVTKSYYVGLGVPVMEEGSNTFAGVLDALIEVSQIFPALHRFESGPTMRALLVKADGTIIYSPGANLSMKVISEEFQAAREAMAAAGRNNGYATTTLRTGVPVLIGYADTGLKESFPNLAWTVLVVQDSREAFAATRGVMRLILFSVGICIVLVTLLAAYFMIHRKGEYVDLKTAERARAAQAAAN